MSTISERRAHHALALVTAFPNRTAYGLLLEHIGQTTSNEQLLWETVQGIERTLMSLVRSGRLTRSPIAHVYAHSPVAHL